MKIQCLAAWALLLHFLCMAGVPVNEISRQKILSADPECQENYDALKPDPTLIEVLKSRIGKNLRSYIYSGLCCSDSRDNVPPFIIVIDTTGVSVPVHFFNVQRKTEKTIQFFSDTFHVERTPTFIFYRGESEIGRIVENPKKSLLEDMIAIL